MSKTSRGYTTQEILALLGVRAHVLRYWVENIALLSPAYDDSGRRRWTSAQARLLLRLRHLIVERGMSVAGAQRTLVEEASNPVGTRKAKLEKLRDELLGLRDLLHPDIDDGAVRTGNPPQRRSVPLRIGDRVSEPGALQDDCASLVVVPKGAFSRTLRMLLGRIGDYPAILAVPGDDEALRTVQDALDSRANRAALVVSDTIGDVADLLGAVAESADIDGWFERNGIESLLYWRPEMDGPVPPVSLLHRRLRERESGVVAAVCAGSGSIEAVLFARNRLKTLYQSLSRAEKLADGSSNGFERLLRVEPRVVLLENCPNRS